MNKKAPKCPECGSEITALIIYGIPSHGLLVGSQKREFILGGCQIKPEAPRYHCKICKNEWGKLEDDSEYF